MKTTKPYQILKNFSKTKIKARNAYFDMLKKNRIVNKTAEQLIKNTLTGQLKLF